MKVAIFRVVVVLGVATCFASGARALCFRDISYYNVRARQLPDRTVEILYDITLGGVGVAVCLDPVVEISNDGGWRYFVAEIAGDKGCCSPNAVGSRPACNTRTKDRRLVWNPRTNPLPFDAQRSFPGSARVQFTDNVTCINFCSNFFTMDISEDPPIVTMVAPAADSTVSGNVTLTAAVELRGGAGLASLEYLVDGALVGRCPSATICSVAWDSRNRPGDHTIVASARNRTGQSGSSSPIKVYVKPPRIEAIDPEYPGFFLKNTAVTNAFHASVDWEGHRPGTVTFTVNGGSAIVERADQDGAKHDFDMASDFVPGHEPSILSVRAQSAYGAESVKRDRKIWVFGYPAWLSDALTRGGSLDMRIGESDVTYAIEADYPVPHLAKDGPMDIPQSIPFIGGKFGLTETYARLQGAVSTRGTGSLTLSGTTGFVAAGNKVGGTVTGSGEFLLGAPKGLALTGASFGLELRGVIEKEIGITEAIPALRELEQLPVIGGSIRVFNESTALRGAISPLLSFTATFAQSERNAQLEFREGTGALGLELEAEVKTKFSDRIEAEAWLAGGGALTLGVPERNGYFARSLDLSLQAGAKFTMDFFSVSAQATYTVSCRWGVSGASCDADALDSAAHLTSAMRDAKIQRTVVDYALFGAYSRLSASGDGPKAIVTNVFTNARPRLVNIDKGSILLWTHQNTILPLLQSTDIMWSRFDGTVWSAPEVLHQDTRAELSPVAGTDRMGRVVAVWLRVKDPSFTTRVETVAELPRFYTQLEVVSAVFDPAVNRWGPISTLTDDLSFDTDLRLAPDAAGNLMLTWISQDSGDLLSSHEARSTLRCSFWDGDRWSTPVAVASGLTGLSAHATALNGRSAFIVVSRDPNPGFVGDSTLDLYTWNGVAWSDAAFFASGGGDNRFVVATFDAAGEGHMLWLRGTDLVSATLSSTTPRIVLRRVPSMSYWDFNVVAVPLGDLVILWRESEPTGSITLYGSIFNTGTRTAGGRTVLFRGESLIRDVDSVYTENGKVAITYVSTEVVRREQVVTTDGKAVTIPNVPSNGASDIRVVEQTLLTDLSLQDTDLTFDPPRPMRGQRSIARIDVHNAGTLATPAFTVSLFAGRPGSGGELLGSVVTDVLRGGEHRVIQISFVTSSDKPLFAIADAMNSVPEYDEKNNVATTAAGKRRAAQHP